jgi:hypothetical protein
MLRLALVLAFAGLLFYQAWSAAQLVPHFVGDHLIAVQNAIR